MSSENIVIINCIVSGDDGERAFSISIKKDSSVSDFKVAIKKYLHPRFEHVVSTDIELYTLNMDVDQLTGVHYDGEKLRNPLEKIKTVLQLPFEANKIHFSVCPIYWREVHCKTKYNGVEKLVRWDVTKDQLTIFNMKNKLFESFSELSTVDRKDFNIFNCGVEPSQKLGDNNLVDLVWNEKYVNIIELEIRTVGIIEEIISALFDNMADRLNEYRLPS